MKRWLAAASSGLALLVVASALVVFVGESRADLDNSVFTSAVHRVRLVVPRGWRATDQPSYPGLLLWMMRTDPPAQIVFTSEVLTHHLYCSWPRECRTTAGSLTEQYACALRDGLTKKKLSVGPIQPGPKENTAAGVPSLWFDYDNGKQFLRLALALSTDRAYSLVLTSPTTAARASALRAFDQALRSLRTITAAEALPVGAVVAPTPLDAAIDDATTAPIDAAPLDAGVTFETAPDQTPLAIVGPCAGEQRLPGP